jgi:predicted dehydrogenase
MKNKLNKILLIGAGQLGSRHLQGIAKSNNKLEIHIVDPSEKNLEVSISRFQEIDRYTNHRIHTYKDITHLVEKVYEVAILATNADVRYKLTKQMIDNLQIKSYVFEKVVFQSEKQFKDINNLFSEADYNAYVNCPRRMWPSYHALKNQLGGYKNIELSVSGTDWGMACNSIHFIDLMAFLTDEADFEIAHYNLIDEIFNSKRSGFIEFNGEIQLRTANGNILNIKCDPKSSPDEKPSQHISIKYGNDKAEIRESAQVVDFYSEETLVRTEGFNILFQSGLSNLFVDELIDNNTCSLTSLEESSKYHLLLFNIFREKYLQLVGKKLEEIPIT